MVEPQTLWSLGSGINMYNWKLEIRKFAIRLYIIAAVKKNLKNYKEAKKATKRAVSEVRSKAYENLYKRFDTKDGEREIYIN